MGANEAGPVILVVDGSLMWRNVLCRALKDKFTGITIKQVGDGDKALHVLAPLPDVIICDMDTPQVDGPSMLRRLRSLETTAKIPVLATTSTTVQTAIVRLLQMGVSGILLKPINVEKLCEKVEKILKDLSYSAKVEVLPRSAVRREISEQVRLLLPVRSLTGEGPLVDMPPGTKFGSHLDCDFSDVCRRMGMPPLSGVVTCATLLISDTPKRVIAGLQPTSQIVQLMEILKSVGQSKEATISILMPGGKPFAIGVDAKTIDLSVTGMSVRTALGLPVGARIALTVNRLMARLFSDARSEEVICSVARHRANGNGYELGLHFEDAPSKFILDVLHWSSAE
jgi:CheY-like chemotaxis protein